MTLNGVIDSPAATALAQPFVDEVTSLSPLFTVPVTLTGVLPVIATNGCDSLLPAPAFMAYAGMSEITPNTLSERSVVDSVISAVPPTSTTAPADIGASASKRSATSAYCADVDKACTTLALMSTKLLAPGPVSSPFGALNADQAPPA